MGVRKKITQEDRVLKYLQTHKRGITQDQATKVLGVSRLGARIFDLKEAGHIIDTDFITVKNRYGESCRVAQYHLIKEKE